MKRLKDIARLIFISPEALWVVFVVFIYLLFSEWLAILGGQLTTNTDAWKALYALPVVFTGIALNYAGKIRAPLGKEENKALYEWPLYHMVVDRVVISVVLCIASCIGSISIWVFTKELSEARIAGLYIVFLGVSGISTIIMIFAEHKLKEILTKYV